MVGSTPSESWGLVEFPQPQYVSILMMMMMMMLMMMMLSGAHPFLSAHVARGRTHGRCLCLDRSWQNYFIKYLKPYGS